MAWGVRIWGESGQPYLDPAFRPVRFVGAVPFGAGSGTIAFQPAAGKTPFAWLHFYGQGAPYITWSNGMFTWGSSGAATGYILYGER